LSTILITYIKHVVHEYANLISAAFHSMNGKEPWRTHCDDAFLGCRKMDDFLMTKTRRVLVDCDKPEDEREELDDILALDYLPEGSTITWSLPVWKKHWHWAMNKQLAHLSYKRDKSWDHTGYGFPGSVPSSKQRGTNSSKRSGANPERQCQYYGYR
jgi:hypothetical protein